jgi:hypothetical protein
MQKAGRGRMECEVLLGGDGHVLELVDELVQAGLWNRREGETIVSALRFTREGESGGVSGRGSSTSGRSSASSSVSMPDWAEAPGTARDTPM